MKYIFSEKEFQDLQTQNQSIGRQGADNLLIQILEGERNVRVNTGMGQDGQPTITYAVSLPDDPWGQLIKILDHYEKLRSKK